jgi:hypothetical protein
MRAPASEGANFFVAFGTVARMQGSIELLAAKGIRAV